MTSWMHYLLEANLYLIVAYGCYWMLYRRQTFYRANRAYLLLSTVICFAIPLVQFEFQPAAFTSVVVLPEVSSFNHLAVRAAAPPSLDIAVSANKAFISTYCLAAALMGVLFAMKLYSLLKLIFESKRTRLGTYTLVYTDQAAAPFSFFGYLFADSTGHLPEAILQHELVHIRQRHSWDIVFTELLKIINWFNPVVYLLQNSLKALHEFEADSFAAANNQQDDYVNMLINQAYQTSGVPFANYFSNQQLLKSRIMNLYQKRSGSLAMLNYLLTVPLCAGLLCASTLAFSKDYGWIKLGVNKKPEHKSTGYSAGFRLVLMVKSGKSSILANRLELTEKDGKVHVYTAANLTQSDSKRMMNDYKISVIAIQKVQITSKKPFNAPPIATNLKIVTAANLTAVTNTTTTVQPEARPASESRSFIGSETLRFKRIVTFEKAKSLPDC